MRAVDPADDADVAVVGHGFEGVDDQAEVGAVDLRVYDHEPLEAERALDAAQVLETSADERPVVGVGPGADIDRYRRRRWPGSRNSWAAAAGLGRAPPAPIAESRRPAAPQRKNSSETFFHSGMPSSVCSGVKKWTRKLPSFGLSVGTLAGTSGCAVM